MFHNAAWCRMQTRLRHQTSSGLWPPVSPVERTPGRWPGCQEYLHHKKNTHVRLYLPAWRWVCVFVYIYSCARVHQLSIFPVISMLEAGQNSPGTVESVSDPDSPDKKMGSPLSFPNFPVQKLNDEKISELDTSVNQRQDVFRHLIFSLHSVPGRCLTMGKKRRKIRWFRSGVRGDVRCSVCISIPHKG